MGGWTKLDIALCKKELKNFLDGEGRLKAYPSRFKLKVAALFYLAANFEFGRRYTESEVNQILQNHHTFEDWAILRRELFDRGFMDREKDCSAYWLEGNQPTLETFGLD